MPSPELPSPHRIPPTLEVLPIEIDGRLENGLFARETFFTEDVIFQFPGKVVPGKRASQKALQIGPDLFWESTAIDRFDDNLNHHCHPNCTIRFSGTPDEPVIELVAITPIAPGEQLSFDYNTTEYDLISQKCSFTCNCGEYCRHSILGFRYLLPEEQESLRPYLSPFLLGVLDGYISPTLR